MARGDLQRPCPLMLREVVTCQRRLRRRARAIDRRGVERGNGGHDRPVGRAADGQHGFRRDRRPGDARGRLVHVVPSSSSGACDRQGTQSGSTRISGLAR